MMNITIRSVGVEQASEVRRIRQVACEEYRGRLVPPSGALTETIEEVREATVGSARDRLCPDHAYAERVAVLPESRGKGGRRRPHGGV
jgi:hypothetical protein